MDAPKTGSGTPFDDGGASDSPDDLPTSDMGPAPALERPPIDTGIRPAPSSVRERVRELVIGPPKDPRDKEVFHKISLIAFLAWVGLGADGLSSSAYGPEEAFKALLEHKEADYTFLAVFLAAATALTVFIISSTYSRIIEHFPYGGGGYVVATKLLGPKAGVVSGSALLVDYVLTIAISVASGADALWSTFPASFSSSPLPLLGHYSHEAGGVTVFDYTWGGLGTKVLFEVLVIGFLIVINLRGVKESVKLLTPIFMVFVITHVIFIVGAIVANAGTFPAVMSEVSAGVSKAMAPGGVGALVLLGIFVRAYSLGGGTYTGIEAVSNGIAIMREPRVQTAKRTMVYMALSLAFTAGGIVLCYLLVHVGRIEGKTMNAVLVDRVAGGIHWGSLPVGATFVVVTLFSETLLLFVAAQAGFIDGPRVMANMALDSWFPHRFASLSDRLTTANGVLLMGGAATLALLSVKGSVDALVVMYSINVFVTFSLSNLGMCRFWVSPTTRAEHPEWPKRLPMHLLGLALCLTILGFTIYEKFWEGAWTTLVVTAVVIALCLMIKSHYGHISDKLKLLNKDLADEKLIPDVAPAPIPLVADKPTAVILVSSWSGIGIHTTLNIFRYFPGYFSNIVFASAAVIDSGNFKGARHIELLQAKTEEMLKKYVAFASSQGVAATYAYSVGTEPVDEAERLCKEASKSYSKCMFFAGQLIFEDERWYHRVLHNNTAYAIQKRLQWDGLPMVILPVRVRGA